MVSTIGKYHGPSSKKFDTWSEFRTLLQRLESDLSRSIKTTTTQSRIRIFLATPIQNDSLRLPKKISNVQ